MGLDWVLWHVGIQSVVSFGLVEPCQTVTWHTDMGSPLEQIILLPYVNRQRQEAISTLPGTSGEDVTTLQVTAHRGQLISASLDFHVEYKGSPTIQGPSQVGRKSLLDGTGS